MFGFEYSKARKMDNQADDFKTRMAKYTYQPPLKPLQRLPVRDYGTVLIGKTGSGKSATGNTILGRTVFKSERSGKSVTGVSSYGKTEYGDHSITVVDTPGMFDNVRSDSAVKQENARMAFLLRHGVHCFVICMNTSEVRVTKETKQFLDQVKVSGDADFFDYCMMVYTKPESELCDTSINEYLEKQKENTDLKFFLDKIGDRVLAVNNKATDPRERKRNKDAIISMVIKVIEDNIIKKNPIVFTNDTFKKANELRVHMVSVVERVRCHPSLVNAVIEAVIWYSKLKTINENEFVEKVIEILCESDLCEENGGMLIFRNDKTDTTTPVAVCKEHVRMIYQATKSHINVFYKILEIINNYNKTYLVTAGAATAGAGLVAGTSGVVAGMSGMVAVGAILGLPAVLAYNIGDKRR